MTKTCGLVIALIASAGLIGCGDDDGQQCFPNDHTACIDGSTWWLDSCGNQGALAEDCECGCNADFSGCDTCTCQADCTGRVCGDDGCGGSCGDCDVGEACNASGQCEPCQADCTGRVCGDDGCGGSCGDCNVGEACNASGQCEGGSSSDLLTFTSCAVPFVLDAAQVGDMTYMGIHFSHLIQQYCVTGTVNNNDITAYPEKMYYGQHDSGSLLSLVQTSLITGMTPQWSVKVDFAPDSSVTTSSIWTIAIGGLNPLEAYVGLLRYLGGSSVCIYAIGTTGQLTFSAAQNVTQIEGGSFTVSGQALMTNPWDISDYCSQTPPNLPCCTR